MATGTVLAPAHERAASRRSSSIAIAGMSGPVVSAGKAEEGDFPDGGKETREVHTLPPKWSVQKLEKKTS